MLSSLKRYVYAVRVLHGKFLCVRAVDLAHYLKFSKASISRAVSQMQENNLIEVEPDGNLLFTPPGEELADQLEERVCFFMNLLTGEGVDPAMALQDSISFSWEMSEESYRAFRNLYDSSEMESEAQS